MPGLLGLGVGRGRLVVDGETLRSLLDVARTRGLVIGLREVCFIVQQLAEGLPRAHGAHAGHRALQPSQVWLSPGGEVRLVEPGGTFRNEPAYLSPEQARGLPVDGRGDVFRLGLMLYELLARRPLFEGTQAELVRRIGSFDERRLEPVPGCPPSLWAVLVRALAAAPEARFPSVRALADALRHFLQERELGVERRDLAQLFARAFPERRPLAPPVLHPVAPASPVKVTAPPSTEPYLMVPPPPPEDACEEGPVGRRPRTSERPGHARLMDWHARLLDEALGLIGDSAALAPLLVRLTRRCVERLGGSDEEESLALTAARALALAARLEESRRFVLPTLARVRSLVGAEFPEVGELLSTVLLAGRDSGPPAGCAAKALLCAATFVVQVQSAEPGAAESARALLALRQDRRIAPAALEALAAELGAGTTPPCSAAAGVAV